MGRPHVEHAPHRRSGLALRGEDTDRRYDGARCTMHDAVVPDPRPVVHVRVLPRPADAPWPVARLWSRMALSAPGTARRAQSEISRVSLASWCMYMSRRAVVSLEPGAGRGCLGICVGVMCRSSVIRALLCAADCRERTCNCAFASPAHGSKGIGVRDALQNRESLSRSWSRFGSFPARSG